MKKVLLIILAVLAIAFTSCKKTDDRDQFIGTYSITSTGSLTYYAYGDSYTSPMNGNGEITITKLSSDNMVHLTGFYNADAEVSGNTIKIDYETQTIDYEGMTVILTIEHRRGTLAGSTLTFTTDISGNVYYQGSSFPASGTMNNIAYKK